MPLFLTSLTCTTWKTIILLLVKFIDVAVQLVVLSQGVSIFLIENLRSHLPVAFGVFPTICLFPDKCSDMVI